MSIIPYIVISILAIIFGQIVAHLNKKMPPVVAEEITYKEFFTSLKSDFKIDFVYSLLFLILFNCFIYFNGNVLDTYLYTLVCVALAITFSIDFRFQLIPDEVHVLLSSIGIIKLIFNFSLKSVLDCILGSLIGGGIFFSISLLALLIFKKEGMGFGDVKLMAALGLVFGAKNILVITLVSFIIGALIGGTALILKKDNDGYIPFGPFIAIAAVILMFIPPDSIIELYIAFCSWLGDKMTEGIYHLIER